MNVQPASPSSARSVARAAMADWWPLLLASAAALVAVQYAQTALAQVAIAGIAVRLLELWLLAGFAMTVLSTLAGVAPGRPWYLRYFHDSGWAFIKLFGWGLALNLLGSVVVAPAAGMGPVVGGVLFIVISGIQYMLMAVFLVCTPDLDFGDAVRGTFHMVRRAPTWCVLLMFVNPGIPLAGGWAVTQLPAVLHAPGAALVAFVQQVLGLTLVTVLISIRVADWHALGEPIEPPEAGGTPGGTDGEVIDVTPEPTNDAANDATSGTAGDSASDASGRTPAIDSGNEHDAAGGASENAPTQSADDKQDEPRS